MEKTQSGERIFWCCVTGFYAWGFLVSIFNSYLRKDIEDSFIIFIDKTLESTSSGIHFRSVLLSIVNICGQFILWGERAAVLPIVDL